MTENFFFFLSILGIAFVLWLVRSLVESEPDPFFLNFTFFAFAGQLIRTSELVADDLDRPLHLGLLLGAAVVVGAQIVVSRNHNSATIEHYENLLRRHKRKACSDVEIERWAKLLLKVTGVDFLPGGYAWFAIAPFLGKKEPRKKRREEGILILPSTKFVTSEFSAADLVVPAEGDRRTLWTLYVTCCVAAWILFGLTVFVQPNTRHDEKQSTETQSTMYEYRVSYVCRTAVNFSTHCLG